MIASNSKNRKKVKQIEVDLKRAYRDPNQSKYRKNKHIHACTVQVAVWDERERDECEVESWVVKQREARRRSRG
jgi:hypothetical protein